MRIVATMIRRISLLCYLKGQNSYAVQNSASHFEQYTVVLLGYKYIFVLQ